MASSTASRKGQHHPHILLLVTDQFRYDAFDPTITPNLYELATTSQEKSATTFFSNAYSSTPTCTPARAALLTGKSPWNHGMLGYAEAVNCESYASTLPSILKDLLGYHTAVVGKNHFGTKPSKDQAHNEFIDHGYQFMELYDGLTQIPDDYDKYFEKMLPGEDPLSTCHLGWNDWKACPYKFDEYLHPTAWTTREALKVLDEHKNSTNSNNRRQALFLKVSYHRPHSPYDPPKRLWEKHQKRSTNTTDPKYKRNIANDSWDKEYFTDFMTHEDWHGDPGEEASRMTRAAYLANAEFVDEGVGKILERWNQLHGDNTIIVWVSDHGDMNGDHNLWRKGYPWEASSHINMVMKLPASKDRAAHDDTISDAIVEIRDVAPTIYDILGILDNVTEIDPLVNGKSLLPILQRRSTSVRNHLDLEHSTVYDERIHWNAIVGSLPENRNSNCKLHKYVFFASTGNEQLFCLSEDPLEYFDLASNRTFEKILSFWRNTMVKNFEVEGRGENWVTSNGTLAIRTSGMNLGPNYPCHSKPSLVATNSQWNFVEQRDDAFLQQHIMNSENSAPKQVTERQLDLVVSNSQSHDGIDFSNNFGSLQVWDQCLELSTICVFVVTALFLSILIRFRCWFKKTKPTKKNF